MNNGTTEVTCSVTNVSRQTLRETAKYNGLETAKMLNRLMPETRVSVAAFQASI